MTFCFTFGPSPVVSGSPKSDSQIPHAFYTFPRPTRLAGPLWRYSEAERKTTMSVSAARQTANAANAQLSTGPRTPEGKAHSSANARKHGLIAADLLIGPEDREEFNTMLADYE